MSSVVNPIGPEEPSTYWRRRAIVGVAILVALWLVWMVISLATGGSDNAAAPTPSPSPSYGLSLTDSPAPDMTTDMTADPTALPTDTGAASASPTSTDGALCAEADVSVEASAATASTPVGAGMAVTISVTNTGTAACKRDVGSGANELRIAANGSTVWSSDHCNPSKAEDLVMLEPNKAWSATVNWDGKQSVKGCAPNQPTAQAGSYQVIARNDGVGSSPADFSVQ